MMKRVIVAAGLIGLWAATPAAAAENAMQACSAKYQAAKKANQVPAGQTWNQYLAACRGAIPKPVAAVKATPGQPSTAQLAARDRQKKCGQMWSADKAGGKLPAGKTWPKYYSACNAKLKG